MAANFTVPRSETHGTGAFCGSSSPILHGRQIPIDEVPEFPGFNHSCAPNVLVVVDDTGNVLAFAMRRIEPGEELTVDYRHHHPGEPLGFVCNCLTCRILKP